jgi:hypothetical protein
VALMSSSGVHDLIKERFNQGDVRAGCSCPDGWVPLVEKLVNHIHWVLTHGITWDQQHGGFPDRSLAFEVTQVKSKFGGLRFYYDMRGDTDCSLAYKIRGAMAFAESLSYTICMDCGATDDVCIRKPGWLATLCPSCAAKGVA